MTRIVVDIETGDVWLSTLGGMSRLSGGKFQNYGSMTLGLTNDFVNDVAIQNDFVWAASATGISRLNIRTREWAISSEKTGPMRERWSYGIAADQQNVYFAVWSEGKFKYDIAGEYWKPYSDHDDEMVLVLFKNRSLIHGVVRSTSYSRDTKIFWSSTYSGMSGYPGHNRYNCPPTDGDRASDFINATQTRGHALRACTYKRLSYLNFGADTRVTYRPSMESGLGEILIEGPDKTASTFNTPASLAHNYILNLAVRGEDILVTTPAGLGRSQHESHNEGETNERARASR